MPKKPGRRTRFSVLGGKRQETKPEAADEEAAAAELKRRRGNLEKSKEKKSGIFTRLYRGEGREKSPEKAKSKRSLLPRGVSGRFGGKSGRILPNQLPKGGSGRISLDASAAAPAAAKEPTAMEAMQQQMEQMEQQLLHLRETESRLDVALQDVADDVAGLDVWVDHMMQVPRS